MRFRDEFSKDLKGESTVFKNIGNVKGSTELTFEYESKSKEELQGLNVDLENLWIMPF